MSEISATHYLPLPGIRLKLQWSRFRPNIRTKQLAVKISANEMNSSMIDRQKKKKKIKHYVIENGHFQDPQGSFRA